MIFPDNFNIKFMVWYRIYFYLYVYNNTEVETYFAFLILKLHLNL